MERQLPDLSQFQLDCLRKFLRFELPIEALHDPLSPLITFDLENPGKLRQVNYSAGIPANPVRVTLDLIESAIARLTRGEITARQLQLWAVMLLMNDAFAWDGPDEDEICVKLNDLAG